MKNSPEYSRRWRLANPEKVAAYQKKWDSKNPGRKSATAKKWHQTHPEESKKKDKERKALAYEKALPAREQLKQIIEGKTTIKRVMQKFNISINKLYVSGLTDEELEHIKSNI